MPNKALLTDVAFATLKTTRQNAIALDRERLSMAMDIWWIDEPRLLGSANPSDADLALLRSEGFAVIVSLLREEVQAPRYDVDRATASGFVRHNIPVRDFAPPTAEQLERFVELVGRLSSGEKAIVHCQGGTGRTGTFAAAYWIAKGTTASDAIERVRETRHGAVETKEQEAALRSFAADRSPVKRNPDRLVCLTDYLTLVYHEARNVRHLIRAGAVEPEPWRYLVALPVGRDEAWEVLQEVRTQARRKTSVSAVLEVFERRFRASLAQLVALYGNQAWRNQAYGGNAWKRIADLVGRLAASLDAGQLDEADALLEALCTARHNTGGLTEKLSRLERNARHEPRT